jgi:4-hydroxybenzoate-CoA ligase
MFKVSGIWVSPFEVEDALISHPKVLEAAVVPAEDDNGLIKPKAFVVLRDRRENDGSRALMKSSRFM